MGAVWLYVRSFWPDWLSRMSGIASVALLAIATIWNRPLPRWSVFLAAAVCYAVASFRVWQQKHRESLTFKKEADEVYADVVLDWIKSNRPARFTADYIGRQLKLPEDRILRGLLFLRALGLVKQELTGQWSYDQMAGASILSGYKRIV